MKRMKLVTNELLKKAVWGEKEVLWEADRILYAKFFHASMSWYWFVAEVQAISGTKDKPHYEFFGWVKGYEAEWGYFSTSDFDELESQTRLPMERDKYFDPIRFGDLGDEYKRG